MVSSRPGDEVTLQELRSRPVRSQPGMSQPPVDSYGCANSFYSFDHDQQNPSDSFSPLGNLNAALSDDQVAQASSSAVHIGDVMSSVSFYGTCATLAPWLCSPCFQILAALDPVGPQAAGTSGVEHSTNQH